MIVHVCFSYLSDAGRIVMRSNIGGKAIFVAFILSYPQLTVSDRHISYVQAKLPDHTITDTCAAVQNGLQTGWIDQPGFKTGWASIVALKQASPF